MAVSIVLFIYLIVALVTFGMGFMLVHGSFKKINMIEGEKFTMEDWLSCFAFGIMFALTFCFAVNLILDVADPGAYPSIAGYILLIMIGILFIYPLWEVIILGRPTSDSVHDFHKLLETKILDRFEGKMAYVMSLVIFMVLYMVPSFLIFGFSESLFEVQLSLFDSALLWFLIFPLFFFAYFSASGQVSAILGATYKNFHYLNPKEECYMTEKQNVVSKGIHLVMILIASWPFINALISLVTGLMDVVTVTTTDLSESDAGGVGLMAAISVATSVLSAVMGFFTKFWNKKSKTKTIDFVFSGYIFIAIGINLLITFISKQPAMVESVLEFSIGSWQPLASLKVMFSNNRVLFPLISISNIVTVIFGIQLFLDRKSDFQADIRLNGVNNAYGMMKIEDIQKGKDVNQMKKSKEKKGKPPKFDIPTLIKSVMLKPVYNQYGIDVNESVRKKAGQFLLLISRDFPVMADNIVKVVAENTIERPAGTKALFTSKEAVDLLGFIGTIPSMSNAMTDRLIAAMPNVDIQLKTYILDALGDVGETLENIKKVLKEITPLLSTPRYEIRKAANLAIVEMVTEGDYQNKEFVNIALSLMYKTLESHKSNPDVIETSLEAILMMCTKIPKDVNFDTIKQYIHYSQEGADPDTIGYIHESAISILASTVYFNTEKFPIDDMIKFMDDPREFIRYVAADALGNFIIKGMTYEQEHILRILMDHSLNDDDPDVTEMCAESVTEFLVTNKNYQVTLDSQKTEILDYYLKALDSDKAIVSENASEALKSIAPMYPGKILPLLEAKVQGGNLEVVRDCMHTIGLLDAETHKIANLDLLYEKAKHKDATVRAEAVFALGMIAENRADVDQTVIVALLDDKDPTVRLEAIFALGKLGTQKPEEITAIIIPRFSALIQEEEGGRTSEIELYAESLGVIGESKPLNEIIVLLQQSLMGDADAFAKDVIAKSLYMVGLGLIKTGKATERIEDTAFYNQISTFSLTGAKKEYTVGNIMIYMIEALQLKGIPESVMDIISDSMQDLFPVFLFVASEKKPNEILNTMKTMLAQAYYSNYNSEILETIARIDSLISFKMYFQTDDPKTKDDALFYSKQFTPDGKQHHDQGITFMEMAADDKRFYDYAEKSFEIAIDLSPAEYFSPNCLFQLGLIYKEKQQFVEAKDKFKESFELFASLDEIGKMKECEQLIAEIDNKLA
jgi:tetratricopeptide (TPR) repeat protein